MIAGLEAESVVAPIAWRNLNKKRKAEQSFEKKINWGLSTADIARHLGINAASITRTISKLEKWGDESYARSPTSRSEKEKYQWQ